MSTTNIAISAAEPPLARRLVKTSCPGVSITRIPGIFVCAFPNLSYNVPQIFWIVSSGKKLAPICCVIPPASLP